MSDQADSRTENGPSEADSSSDDDSPNNEQSVAGSDPLPAVGRLLGIDFGTVRIGLALCDESQSWVTPLETYTRRNERLDAKHFVSIVSSESLVGIVVGLPIHCDGKESQKSQEVRTFCDWLLSATGLPIAHYDERFTTAEARRLLGERSLSAKAKKQKLDGVAAYLILSHYLDSNRNSPAPAAGLDDAPE
ncbi:MAG: Holliday junction resolvase RuvX [Aureliella sp.]